MEKILFRTLLGGNGNFSFSLDCLSSFTKFCKNHYKLEIFEDGTLSKSQITKLQELGNVEVISKDLRDSILTQKLTVFRNCSKFRKNHVFAFKILDTMLLDDNDFYYFDTDVLFFRDFTFENKYPEHPVFMKDIESSYAFSFSRYLKNSWRVPPKLNAGFMFFPKSLFSIIELENIIANNFNEQELKDCWAEQTMWAFLASPYKTNYFNPLQIVMADAYTQIKNETIAIHLTTPFRYKVEMLQKSRVLNTNVKPISQIEIKNKLVPFNYLLVKDLNKLKRKTLRLLSIMPSKF